MLRGRNGQSSQYIIKKYFGVNNSQEIGQSVLSEYVSVTNGVLLSRKL